MKEVTIRRPRPLMVEGERLRRALGPVEPVRKGRVDRCCDWVCDHWSIVFGLALSVPIVIAIAAGNC